MEYDFEWFKDRVYELTTINLNKYKEQQMKRRINTYIYRRLKMDFQEFYEVIANDSHQLDNFVEYLTINVSEFFRNPEQWDILKNELLPEIIRTKGKVRIWSSACSSGRKPPFHGHHGHRRKWVSQPERACRRTGPAWRVHSGKSRSPDQRW